MKTVAIFSFTLLFLPLISVAQIISEQGQMTSPEKRLEALLVDLRDSSSGAFIIKRMGGPSSQSGLRIELPYNGNWYIIENDWWSTGLKIQIQISRYVPSDEVLMIDDDGDGRVNVGWQKDGKIFSSSNTYGLIGQQHRQYWQIRYDYVLVMLSVLAQK